MSDDAPVLDRVLETCLYARDLAAARSFYHDVLGLPIVLELHGRHIFFRCGQGMLLVFDPEASAHSPAGPGHVPAHGTHGPGHAAFAVDDAAIGRWRTHLAHHGIAIETEVEWPRGGRSLYVRDPAGNSIELATPSVWAFA